MDITDLRIDLAECKLNSEHYKRQLERMDAVLRDYFAQLSEISTKMARHEETHPNEVTKIIDNKLMDLKGERRKDEEQQTILLKLGSKVREALKEAQDLKMEMRLLEVKERGKWEQNDKQMLEMKMEKGNLEHDFEKLKDSNKDLEFEFRSLRKIVEDLHKKTKSLEANQAKFESYERDMDIMKVVAVILAVYFLVRYTNSAMRRPPRYLQRFRRCKTPVQATSDTDAVHSRSSRRPLNLLQ